MLSGGCAHRTSCLGSAVVLDARAMGRSWGAVVWVTLAVFLSVCERGKAVPTLPSPPQVPRPV